MKLDLVIFGGGVAGLWILDEAVRRGRSAVLLESRQLGYGQTVASQGILHGGLKYTLQGLLTKSASAIREMPGVWRDCLNGDREPALTNTRVRSEICHLWRTQSVSSRLGMIGARVGLRVKPTNLANSQRPELLRSCPGKVAVMEEQVISPALLLADFAERHRQRLLKIDPARGLNFTTDNGGIKEIQLSHPDAVDPIRLEPAQVVFAAGGGNASLREQVGLETEVMQRRPLHMVLARGKLPVLNGHCVDGAKTRVTITTDVDSTRRTVWQIGGQVAEDGVGMSDDDLIRHVRTELTAVIPGVNLQDTEWTTYRVDRAEGVTGAGLRPDTFQILQDGNVLTVWPTKLVLAPKLAESVAELFTEPSGSTPRLPTAWPRPTVAEPPWETARKWQSFESGARDAA